MLQFPHSENVFDNGSDTYPGPFHERIFHRYSNSIENRFYGNCIVGFHISPNFCTCHDSIAVVPCAQFRSDHLTTTRMGSEWNFHRIWITMENSFMKWAPANTFQPEKTHPSCFPTALVYSQDELTAWDWVSMPTSVIVSSHPVSYLCVLRRNRL